MHKLKIASFFIDVYYNNIIIFFLKDIDEKNKKKNETFKIFEITIKTIQKLKVKKVKFHKEKRIYNGGNVVKQIPWVECIVSFSNSTPILIQSSNHKGQHY